MKNSLDQGPGPFSVYSLQLVREACDQKVPTPRTSVDMPARAVELVAPILETYDREVMGVLFLDARSRFIGYTISYIGTLTRASVEPRGIFAPALLANAHKVIVFHNHPSGDPTPSQKDIRFTRRLAEAGEILGIELLDSLVIADRDNWVSLRRRGSF